MKVKILIAMCAFYILAIDGLSNRAYGNSPDNYFIYEIDLIARNDISLFSYPGHQPIISDPVPQMDEDLQVFRLVLSNNNIYGSCRFSGLRTATIRIRWHVPETFSQDPNRMSQYDIIVTFISPPSESPVPRIFINPPSGFGENYISYLENISAGDIELSIEKFFSSSFLFEHFRYTLPYAHGRRTRVANIISDHLFHTIQYPNDMDRRMPPILKPGRDFVLRMREHAPVEVARYISQYNIRFYGYIHSFVLNAINLYNSDRSNCPRSINLIEEVYNCLQFIEQNDPGLVEYQYSVATRREVLTRLYWEREPFIMLDRLNDARATCMPG